MIAVTGTSGQTGSACAEALLRAGERVRVVVRDPSKARPWTARGADVAVASLDDADALARALDGVNAAYLLVPPNYAAADLLAAQQLVVAALADAVTRARVPHTVLLSSMGAQHATGVGPVRTLHAAEQALRRTGQPVTFLRAPYFIENWAAGLQAAAADGVLPSFIPLDQPVETGATADIGAVAAELLQGPVPSGTRTLEMGGHAPVTARQIAATLGQALGRHVEPVLVPPEQVVPTFTGLGFPESTAALMREMYEGLQSGRVTFEDPAAPHVRGLRTPADVLVPLLAGT